MSVSGGLVKQEIQARYDELSQRTLSELEGAPKPEQVWRMVEGARPALSYFRRRKIETALALGDFSPGSAILEVGCGTGDYTFLLARMGFKMTGVDLSPKSIEAAREKATLLGLESVSLVMSDAEDLREISDAAVDGVVSFSTLRYVPDLKRALRAIWRVLRPGGVAVVDFPNRYCPWFTLLKNHFGVENHIHDHQYSAHEIVRLAGDAGFEEVAVRRILFTPYVLPRSLLPLFKWVDRVGERLPGLNHTAGIIVARGMKA